MFRTALSVLGLAFLGVLTVSCSSHSDEYRELDDPDLPAVAVNPDGVPYPTDRIGGRKRSGTRPGNRMPNFAFRAYRSSGRAGGLETLSLADYFDPEQKQYKVLHLRIAATWCAICSSELEATVPVTETLKPKGVVFVGIIVSGATGGKGPSLAEVDGWIDRHKTNFPTAVDVRARRLATIGINVGVMPHDILIDTRTMEILDSSAGAPVDIVQYTGTALKFVTTFPPSF